MGSVKARLLDTKPEAREVTVSSASAGLPGALYKGSEKHDDDETMMTMSMTMVMMRMVMVTGVMMM
eukprot:1084894-Pyramimonas_sp.AAC.1